MQEDYEEEEQEIPVRNAPRAAPKKKPLDTGLSRTEIELYVALFCLGIAYLLLIDVVL